MRRKWVGKNVDVALLSRCAEHFFKSKGFRTKADKSAGECKIVLTSQRTPNTHEKVDVKISGDSSDFAIEFSFGKRARSKILLGHVTAMIGGGGLLLRELRSLEALERLEKEFWVNIERCVERLANSARR